MGPPYTRQVQFIMSGLRNNRELNGLVKNEDAKETHVNSAPVTLGKQRMGTMRMTKAEAMTPTGILYLPRFQGPARKRLPTKKTRMKMGVVKARYKH